MNISIAAKVDKIVFDSLHGFNRMILTDIYIDGEKWEKDHLWINITKRLSILSKGDFFVATAKMYNYIDLDTNKNTKKGVKSFRNIKRVNFQCP